MKRYYKYDGKYYYHKKSDLITDICEALQAAKKTYKKQPLYFHKVFKLDNNKTCEEWNFTIIITNEFTVYNCVLHYWDNNFKCHIIKYCVNDYDKEVNITFSFKNITEFREFLNREMEK